MTVPPAPAQPRTDGLTRFEKIVVGVSGILSAIAWGTVTLSAFPV